MEKEIAEWILAAVIGIAVLLIIFNYSIKIGWDEGFSCYTIKWEDLVDRWEFPDSRHRQLKLHIWKLPKWMNIFKRK